MELEELKNKEMNYYIESLQKSVDELIKDAEKKRDNVYVLLREAVLDFNRYFNNNERLNALLDAFRACTDNHYSILFEYEHNTNRAFHKQRISVIRLIYNGVEVARDKINLD